METILTSSSRPEGPAGRGFQRGGAPLGGVDSSGVTAPQGFKSTCELHLFRDATGWGGGCIRSTSTGAAASCTCLRTRSRMRIVIVLLLYKGSLAMCSSAGTICSWYFLLCSSSDRAYGVTISAGLYNTRSESRWMSGASGSGIANSAASGMGPISAIRASCSCWCFLTVS